MSEIKFGVFDHLERRGDTVDGLYQGRIALVRDYEAAGFYGYHVAEHHATPLGMAPSPGIFLAAAAQATRRIHLGPLVYLLPLYNPLRLVNEICMLDQISGGRLEIGVGRGVSPFELAYYGVPFLDSREIFEELRIASKGDISDYYGMTWERIDEEMGCTRHARRSDTQERRASMKAEISPIQAER